MNRRAYAAVVRLAVVRGRTGFLVAIGLATAGLLGALLLPGWMATFAAIAGALSLLVTTVGAPLSSLAREKILGHLDFDRTLPVPLRTLGAGRLSGAAVRTLPVAIGLTAIGIALLEQSPDLRVSSLSVALLLLLLLYWAILWISYALVARFPIRWLAWFPGIIWVALVIMPTSVESAISAQVTATANLLFRQADPSAFALIMVAAAALVLTAACFAGANAILVSALARFLPDPNALASLLEAAPKSELVATGRGPVLAIAGLQLRLAAAKLRRELIIAGVAVVVIVADIGTLAEMARFYLPILAGLIPIAVALHLTQARLTGTLEGMQQLPISRWSVALGHVLAVMALAIPSVVITAVSRATDGLTLNAGVLATRWFLVVAIGAAAAAMAVWGTKRRLAMLFIGAIATSIVVIVLASWIVSVADIPFAQHIEPLASSSVRVVTPVMRAIGISVAMVVVTIATATFARGLATYQAPVVK